VGSRHRQRRRTRAPRRAPPKLTDPDRSVTTEASRRPDFPEADCLTDELLQRREHTLFGIESRAAPIETVMARCGKQVDIRAWPPVSR
jgi:hypothetical protein